VTYLNKKELPKVETRLEIKNEVGNGPAQLFIYGRIRPALPWDNEDDDTHISAKAVRNKLNEVAEDKDLEVHVNSPGGEVFESITIRNLLVQHKGDVKIIIDGLAASGASLIATAGKVIMFENSMQMIHKAWGMAIGNSDDMEKMAEDLKKVDESVLASYMKKFVGEKKELKELISDETWLTAEEALTFGLADEIWEDAEEDDENGEGAQNNTKENLFMKYRKQNNSKKPDKEPGLFNAFKKSQGDDN